MTNDEQDAALLRLEMAAETAATVLAVVGRIWDQKYLQIRRDQGLDLGFRALGERLGGDALVLWIITCTLQRPARARAPARVQVSSPVSDSPVA
jgi:hypothetical protein